MLDRLDKIVRLARAPERLARRTIATAVSDTARDLLDRTLSGPLVEAIARDIARHAVIQRAAGELFADPDLERFAVATLDSAGTERLVAEVIESRLLDAAVQRLLESDELWLLVDEIAHSPSVTDAIGQQSLGFADQIAGTVRERSVTADARLERTARRLLRRGQRDGGS